MRDNDVWTVTSVCTDLLDLNTHFIITFFFSSFMMEDTLYSFKFLSSRTPLHLPPLWLPALQISSSVRQTAATYICSRQLTGIVELGLDSVARHSTGLATLVDVMHTCSIYVFVHCFGVIVISGQLLVVCSPTRQSSDASHRHEAFACN